MKGRKQFPIKLELQIPRNVKVSSCAGINKEWFELTKTKDPTARVITYKVVAVSDVRKSFSPEDNQTTGTTKSSGSNLRDRSGGKFPGVEDVQQGDDVVPL